METSMHIYILNIIFVPIAQYFIALCSVFSKKQTIKLCIARKQSINCVCLLYTVTHIPLLLYIIQELVPPTSPSGHPASSVSDREHACASRTKPYHLLDFTYWILLGDFTLTA